MNKLVKTETLPSQKIEYALLADDPDALASDIEETMKRHGPEHLTIDIRALEPADQVSAVNTIREGYRGLCTVFIPAAGIDREHFENFQGVSRMEPVADGFSFSFDKEAKADLGKQFDVLKQNFSLKEKSYEMEIIESLVEESGRETQKYQMLKADYDSLKATQSAGRDRDLERRYLELMEKYKQALQRLQKLRQSKLGRLQMAYWRKRGRQ